MNDTLEIMKAAIRECLDELAGRDRRVEQALTEAAEKLTQPMQVAVVGRLSSSKSSLVNALLGDESVAATDKAEETFNVSLIKYGADKEEITIVTRDGSRIRTSRSHLRDWSGRGGKYADNPNISHIELSDDNPFLKTVRIIDTPGLDSSYGKDSENTVRFLEQARPDAIVMLFTKSINADTLETLREFQKRLCTDNYSVSPMNAIGVMAKTDEFWKITDPGNSPLERGSNVIASLLDFHPGLLHTFLAIYPISALTALAAIRLEDENLNLLRRLTSLTPQQKIVTFASARGFLTEISGVDLTEEERHRLLDRLGLYGAWAALEELTRNPDATLDDIKKTLARESGVPALTDVVISHFGKRASIIKTRNAIAGVSHVVNRVRTECTDAALAHSLDNITGRLDRALRTVGEFDIWSLLSKVYDGRLSLSDPEALADLKSLAGENGYSAAEKLRLAHDATPHELLEKARERSFIWARKYNFYRMRRRREPAFVYRTLSFSFRRLAGEIEKSLRRIEESKKTIDDCRRFLFGRPDSRQSR